jgi:glyoxylase-like metal-dependent hydrolase (beta-lactamase superfamily II)
MAENSRLYFRQVLAGMDTAEDDPIAQQMVNFQYLIGDRETGEAVVVDPAYDPQGLIDILDADGMRLVGALGTHFHADHVGGNLWGHQLVGIAELLDLAQVPIHVQADEVEWVTKTTGVPADHLAAHASGDIVMVGEIPITLIHTPGHTPGSQCFLVDGKALVAGDTLFLDGCGRTDLPGSDPTEMYYSLTQRLAAVPDDAVLYPGHLYSEKPAASMAETRSRNVVFRPQSLEQWLMMFAS